MTGGTAGLSPMSPRVTSILDRIEYRVANTEHERERIYRLRYDAYLREDAIRESDSMRLADRFDALPNSELYGIYLDELLIASIRLHVVDKGSRTSPAVHAFPDALEPLMEQGLTIVDPNRFVVDRSIGKQFPELPYVVLRLPFMAAGYFGADIVTATVRQEHAAFYRKVLRCHHVCEPRSYPTLIKPLGLMMVNYPIEHPNVLSRHPCFAARLGESHDLFKNIDSHATVSVGYH
jgi:hypothetical protein